MYELFPSPIHLAQAAALPDAPSTVSVVVVGFLFVILVLALLAAVTSAIGAFFIKSAARDAAKAAVAAEKAAEASARAAGHATLADAPAVSRQTDADAEDPALLAVIAAAVHMVIGDRAHRVISVRSAGPGWAQEGRRQIFSSHRMR